MENATKALLIAAGVLIGVLILSLGVYLFNIFGEFSANTQSKVDANEIAQFNAKFLQYVGRTDLTIHDIITVKNYALEHNKKFANYKAVRDMAEDNNEYIDVYFGDSGADHIWKDDRAGLILFWTSDESRLEAKFKAEDENIFYKYTCEVKINNNTGKVNKIYFTRYKQKPEE